MNSKTTGRKVAEVAVGAVIGGVIAGPLGAVAGGLAAGQVESGLERPDAQDQSGAEDPIVHAHPKRILVPLDFSAPARRALRFAREWAGVFGAEVCLLHVLEPDAPAETAGTEATGAGHLAVVERTKAALQEIACQEFPDPLRVRVEVRQGVPYDRIAAAAVELGADLIVVATHGRTGLMHALLGSTAERVARHAPCPVLILRRAPVSQSSTTPTTTPQTGKD